MDPYTPRKGVGARKKNLTLSAKEYTKVSFAPLGGESEES
jgi:gamma-tubulin complex component 2